MARSRSEFHTLLKTITDNVYFQPPENLKLEYPCIVYRREDMDFKHADNQPYDHDKKYEVTVIDRDPDSEVAEGVASLPMCSFNRFFTADSLNHDVYQVFF